MVSKRPETTSLKTFRMMGRLNCQVILADLVKKGKSNEMEMHCDLWWKHNSIWSIKEDTYITVYQEDYLEENYCFLYCLFSLRKCTDFKVLKLRLSPNLKIEKRPKCPIIFRKDFSPFYFQKAWPQSSVLVNSNHSLYMPIYETKVSESKFHNCKQVLSSEKILDRHTNKH